jgi:preprotein translocase subunit SecG
MQTVLIAFHLLIVLALVAVVLLQRSEGGALGVGGGSGFMTGRGQANVLTRATAILAAIFFATSLGLSIYARYSHSNKSILDNIAPAGSSQPASTLPPKQPGTVLDQLRKIEEQRAGAPASSTETPATAPPPDSTTSSGSRPPAGSK